MSKQFKRLEVADKNTYRLLLEMWKGAGDAIDALDERLTLIRSWPTRSADADKALTEALSHLRKFRANLDQSLRAEVLETGPDGGPLIWIQNREGMYAEAEVDMKS